MKATVSHRQREEFLSEQELKVIALVTNLEYCSVFLKLFRQSPRDNAPLWGVYISNALSSLYESLKLFDTLKKDIILLIREHSLPDEFIEAWEYLTSKDANLFKSKTLANIRNKITYHVDPGIIDDYYKLSPKRKFPALWEYNDDSEFHWHSPVAQEILAVSLNTYFFEEIDHIDRILETYTKLSFLTLSLSTLWVGGHVQQE